ncbi:MAG: CoA-binding protein [Streptosporangiales bacterium]|nr:CoA-binding protein [Streptosporangiales bacterium]
MRPADDLSRLLNPRAVAVVGASENPARIGGQPVRALKEFGFAGEVHPVNPRYETLQGLQCYPNVTAVPLPCDVALVALPAPLVPGVITECGKAEIPFAIVLSAGFEEVGEDGEQLQADLDEAIRTSGVRVVGPNCQGILSPRHQVYAGFGAIFTEPGLSSGPIAMVTQSGGFGYAVMGLAERAGIGFDYVVSTGNETDVDALDVLADLLERDEVEVLAVYLEGVRDGRRLAELGDRALELGKPIVVWKVGNSAPGRQAAASHTANLTAAPEMYRAVFTEGGFVEVRDVDDLVDVARAVLQRKRARGPHTAVLSISGGAGVLLADRCEEAGLQLAALSAETTEALRATLPAFSSLRNPVDLTAQIFNQPDCLHSVLTAVLADPGVDQVILYNASIQGALADQLAAEVVASVDGSDKPLFLGWSAPPEHIAAALAVLHDHRVPWYPTPGRAAYAAGKLLEFTAKAQRGVRRLPDGRPTPQPVDIRPGERVLGEHRTKQALADYGVPVVREALLTPADIEALTEPPLPFPLAVKVESPDLPHKSEAGAVRLGIRDLDELKVAARTVVDNARAYAPEAHVDGVLVQETATGTELFVGVVDDAFFGPTVAVGLGGVLVEVMGDVTHRMAPFGPETARDMLAELRGAAVLRGARGKPAADLDVLSDVLARISWFAADHTGDFTELDVNPLFVDGDRVVAADALLVLPDGERSTR